MERADMYGEIKKFREDIGFGVIVAEDGRKFRFTDSEILNREEMQEGREVNFVVAGLRPHSIIVISGSPWTAFGGIAS
jgi:cold shock CspA family protein